MKRVCFVEMEGILLSHKDYSPNPKRVSAFVKKLTGFCKKENIDLYLLSGFHEIIAKKEFKKSGFEKYFDKGHFLFVDEEYISNKADIDEKIHRGSLEKDPEFVDSYFKQIVIQKIIEKDSVPNESVLLLCNDIWVDAYYTTRFSKVDFALFEENILERGNKAPSLLGLAYFSLKFDSVKVLLESFPSIDLTALDKFVFNTMKKLLLEEVDFSGVAKKVSESKAGNKLGGLNETKLT